MTAYKDEITPPGTEPKRQMKQKVIRFLIHVFGWIGIAMLYYVAFSLFFDTPLEYQMKNSTETLRQQYDQLNLRYDSVEMVLDNVVERDRNVFRILFESDPYNLESDAETEKWMAYEKLLTRNNKELGTELAERTRKMEKKLGDLERTYLAMEDKINAAGDKINYIPSIQPVINNELTLLTASFGLRIHPFYKTLASHMGVDYTVPEGSRVFATADGRVKEVVTRNTSTSGQTVTISHGNGYETQYNHLNKINVKIGDQVKRGDIIALSGNTGLSLAPHLHYEIRHNGMRIDPIHYFFMELSPSDYRKIINVALSGMQSFD